MGILKRGVETRLIASGVRSYYFPPANAQCPLALSEVEGMPNAHFLNSRTIKKIFNYPIRIFALRVVGWFVAKLSWRQA